MKIFDALKKLFSFPGCSSNGQEEPDSAGQDNERRLAAQDEAECREAPSPSEEDGWADAAEYIQLGFTEFTTEKGAIGFYLDPDNRWIQLAGEVFRPGMEELYQERLMQLRDTTKGGRLAARLEKLKQDEEVAAYGAQLAMPHIDLAVSRAVADKTSVEGEESKAGRNPFPFRLVFGILAAQAILNLSDRGICKLVAESPYLQYFLGFTSFSTRHTVHPSSLVHFKKRLDEPTMEKINGIVHKNLLSAADFKAAVHAGAEDACPENTGRAQSGDAGRGETPGGIPGNSGTLILDATCGPVNIRYPQDFSLLNEGRLDLEAIINRLCNDYQFPKPRTYVRTIQKEATNLSKSKRKSGEDIRHVLRLELNAVKRNLEHIDNFLANGPSDMLYVEEIEKIQIIRAVYAQQKYMFDSKTHRVTNRIVSLSLPFVRPISRGKVNRPTEFGPKYDIAVDEDGFSWITCFSFDNFSESTHLKDAVESYKEKTGHYPDRVLVDQIYRNTENRKYCKDLGIRISGPPLGRKPKDEDVLQELISVEKQDMTDRISVERHFSREKRCFGIEEIVERTEETIGHAIGMAVFLDNVVPAGF